MPDYTQWRSDYCARRDRIAAPNRSVSTWDSRSPTISVLDGSPVCPCSIVGAFDPASGTSGPDVVMVSSTPGSPCPRLGMANQPSCLPCPRSSGVPSRPALVHRPATAQGPPGNWPASRPVRSRRGRSAHEAARRSRSSRHSPRAVDSETPPRGAGARRDRRSGP
jgi:hypothetical protein